MNSWIFKNEMEFTCLLIKRIFTFFNRIPDFCKTKERFYGRAGDDEWKCITHFEVTIIFRNIKKTAKLILSKIRWNRNKILISIKIWLVTGTHSFIPAIGASFIL